MGGERGIGAAARGVHQGQSSASSEAHRQPPPELMATRRLETTGGGQGWHPHLKATPRVPNPVSHTGNSRCSFHRLLLSACATPRGESRGESGLWGFRQTPLPCFGKGTPSHASAQSGATSLNPAPLCWAVRKAPSAGLDGGMKWEDQVVLAPVPGGLWDDGPLTFAVHRRWLPKEGVWGSVGEEEKTARARDLHEERSHEGQKAVQPGGAPLGKAGST